MWIWQLNLGMLLSIDAPAGSVKSVCHASKVFVEIFSRTVENVRNLALYGTVNMVLKALNLQRFKYK